MPKKDKEQSVTDESIQDKDQKPPQAKKNGTNDKESTKPDQDGKQEAQTGEEQGVEQKVEQQETDKTEVEADSKPLDSIDEPSEDPLKKLEQQNQEMNDKYVRLMAELENFKRRSIQETQQRLKYASQTLALDIIAGLDNLERALEHAKEQDGDNPELLNFVSGMEMVRQQFYDALKKSNIERIEPQGESFDPTRHEAMGMSATGKVEVGAVAEVYQAGYLYHDRLIRPARVLVEQQSEEWSGGS